MKQLLVTFVGVLVMATAAAAQDGLPETRTGRMAAAYIEAFNAGPDAMRAFYGEWISPRDLEQVPIALRLRMYERISGDVGHMKLIEVLRESDRGIVLLVESSTEERIELQLMLDPNDPRYLGGVMFEEASGEGEAPVPDGPPMTEAALADSIDALVERLNAEDVFSGVACVVAGGREVHRRAIGLAERRFDVPVHFDTKFNVGSISKLWTKIAIARLAAAGKLGLEDRIETHLPEYPEPVASRVTIRQLVDHTSGLGDIFGERYDAIDKSSLRSISDFMRLFENDPLRFEPGTDRYYSNAGYTVLGAIIERVTGMDYDAYMREKVFAPAGMNSTGSLVGDRPIRHLATGYTRRPRPDQRTAEDREARAAHLMADDAHHEAVIDDRTWELRENSYQLPGLSSSAGGGYSTAGDLVRFADAFRTDRMLPAAWTQWVLGGDVPADDTEAGPTLEAYPVGAAVGLGGGAEGISAVLEMYLNPEVTVVVLANMDPPIAERIGRAIRGWVKRAGLIVPAGTAAD